MITRAATLVVVATAVVLAPSAIAGADPAGPTDYESEIVGIDPDHPAVSLRIEGGDSFVVIEVGPGTEVVVPGYRGEPYLWIDTDGSVWENRRSPAVALNAERYGDVAVPPSADHLAPPDWRRVGTGGSWAWHDHRAHRMERFPPVNAQRGDQVLDGSILLVVDGSEVSVRITSQWMVAPSPWPAIAGAALAAALLWWGRRHPATIVMAIAAAALGVGVAQVRSLHPATEPPWRWWLLPAIALTSAVVAVMADLARRRTRDDRLRRVGPWHRLRPSAATLEMLRMGGGLIGAVQLLVWGLDRRLGLWRAVLPTDVPFWLDRAVTAAALTAGLGASVIIAMGGGAMGGGAMGRRALLRSAPSQPVPARSPR